MLESLLPGYDAVYVVSDLHLGGFVGSYGGARRDYRIFRESAALATFVAQLSQDARNICLVLNGDIVDFLAEEEGAYFDWVGALAKLKRIMSDPDQVVVWEALRGYVAAGKDLVLVLGNHDVELALLLREDLQHSLNVVLLTADFWVRLDMKRQVEVQVVDRDPAFGLVLLDVFEDLIPTRLVGRGVLARRSDQAAVRDDPVRA